jgi:hypothetical protein
VRRSRPNASCKASMLSDTVTATTPCKRMQLCHMVRISA